MAKQYWLMKSEPDPYSIDWLKKGKKTRWEGVRNYTARNFMRDKMRTGDGVLYYHSSVAVPGVAGLAEITAGPVPDATQFEPKSPYYDPKATPNAPRWFAVEVSFRKKAREVIPAMLMRQTPGLERMELFRQGRLSITPVRPEEWKLVTSMKEYW